MTAFIHKLIRYVPMDGDITSRRERFSRALSRYRQYPHLRSARAPWNAAQHLLRWTWGTEETRRAWTEQQLGIEGPYHWIFIAGCNNSGTTLLRKVLELHPEIRGLPREGQTLTDALPTPSLLGIARLFTQRMDIFRWTEDSDPTPALRVQYDWARFFPQGPGHLLVKSPENTVRTRWLQRHFAPSRFVAMVRSPYAVCEGTRRRNGHSIAEAARHWSRVNECLLADLPHLEQQVLLRYETFCADPVVSLRKLQQFLHLERPFPPDCLQPKQVHNITSEAAPIHDFNARSLQRLSADDIRTINRIAGPVMQQLGYETITPSSPGPVTSAAAPKPVH